MPAAAPGTPPTAPTLPPCPPALPGGVNICNYSTKREGAGYGERAFSTAPLRRARCLASVGSVALCAARCLGASAWGASGCGAHFTAPHSCALLVGDGLALGGLRCALGFALLRPCALLVGSVALCVSGNHPPSKPRSRGWYALRATSRGRMGDAARFVFLLAIGDALLRGKLIFVYDSSAFLRVNALFSIKVS